MATLYTLLPYSIDYSQNGAVLGINAGVRPYVDYPNSSTPAAAWTMVAPQGLTTPLSLVVTWSCTGTSGNVQFNAQVGAVSDGDVISMNGTTDYDTANSGSSAAVPGTANRPKQSTITLTNNASVAAADIMRILLTRYNSVSGNTSGNVWVYSVELRDAS